MNNSDQIDILYYSSLSSDEKKHIESQAQLIAKKSLVDINIAHNIEIIHVLSKSYGYKPEVLLIYSKKVLVGYIPLLILNDKAISIPHFSYGGYCGIKHLTQINIKKIINSISANYKGGFLIRDFQSYSKNTFTEKVTYQLRLEKSTSNQFASFNKKIRSQIRKAEKNKIIIEEGNLYEFYLIYSENMHYKHGSPQLSFDFFENLLSLYSSGRTKIFVAKLEEKIIGASIIVGYQNFLEVCWAATSTKYNHLSTNMLLYWNMISYAIDHEYNIFSFGRSNRDSGSERFKKQWGGAQVQLIWSSDRDIDLSHSKLKFLTKIWRFTPSFLTNALSPIITKYIY